MPKTFIPTPYPLKGRKMQLKAQAESKTFLHFAFCLKALDFRLVLYFVLNE
jgi:hypothetical protein